ncbi:MAG: alpha/beta hydrolase [Bacteroidota bacterium]
MKADSLQAWGSSGEYIPFGPFSHRVFVKQLGDPQATAERTLLLVHGFPESSYTYHAVVDGLQNTFERIILFDFPGFGWSDKPEATYEYSLMVHADVAFAVWQHFGVKGGHVLAHDMGVSVATEILARHEQDLLPKWFSVGLQSLTLTNGSMVLEFARLRITQKLLLSRNGGFFNRLFIIYRLFRHQIRSAHGNDRLADGEIWALWEGNVLQDGHRKIYRLIRYYRERARFEKTRWLPALARTALPLHLCWGDQDAVAKVAMAHYLKEKVCSQATLTIMSGLGHFGQMGSPAEWVAAVEAFYRK